MANGLLAKNGIIVTGSIEVQNAVTASAFSGDGSALTGISTDPFPYTGSAEISGSLEVIGNLDLNSPNNNVIIGKEAGQNDPANQNVFVGYQAGKNVTSGKHVAIGYQAGAGMTSIQNVAIGHLAGGTGGAYNITIGADARRNSAGQANISIGHAAFRSHGSNNNAIGIGYAVGRFGGGTGAILLGYQAGYNLSGDYNIGLGYDIGYNLTGEYNTVLGYQAGYNISGSKNVVLGYQAGYNLTGSNQLIIANTGSHALVTGDFVNNTFNISGSVSASTYYGDGSNLTGISSDPFPYTGSAEISGSLEVIGGLNVYGSSTANPLTITSAGKIGIATTSPRNDAALTMGSKLTFTSAWGLIEMRSIPSTGGNIMRFGPSAASQGFIKGAEGFGIGTSNGSGGPGAWEVWGKGGGGELVRTSWTSGYAAYHGTVAYGAGQPRPFHLITPNNLNQIVLHTGSYVGIGLEDPQTKLHVSGAVSASTYYGDGSNLTGISSDPFPYTGSAEISGSLTVRDADTTLRGTLNVKGEGTDTSILKLGGNVNSGGSIRLDFKHHTTDNNAAASIRSSGTAYGTSATGLQFFAKGTNTSDGADLTSDNLIFQISYNNGLEVFKNFSCIGGDLQFGHVGNNTSAEKRVGVKIDEPNQTQSSLHLEAGQATYQNRAGGHLRLKAGGGSGTGDSGEISFFTCTGSLTSGEENTVLERARFTPNGDFGIGTTTPTEKLTVEGNISASGNFITDNNITASGHISASTYYGDGSNLTNLPSEDGINFFTMFIA